LDIVSSGPVTLIYIRQFNEFLDIVSSGPMTLMKF